MSFTFNTGLGMLGYYASLPGANDAIIAIPLEASGLESDATLKDKATFAAVVSGTTNEQTTLGRKTLTTVTSTINNTDDRRDMDSDDITWTGSAGNAIAAIVLCYDPDTTTGTDADLIPLTCHTFAATPDGLDITATVTDWARAA